MVLLNLDGSVYAVIREWEVCGWEKAAGGQERSHTFPCWCQSRLEPFREVQHGLLTARWWPAALAAAGDGRRCLWGWWGGEESLLWVVQPGLLPSSPGIVGSMTWLCQVAAMQDHSSHLSKKSWCVVICALYICPITNALHLCVYMSLRLRKTACLTPWQKILSPETHF